MLLDKENINVGGVRLQWYLRLIFKTIGTVVISFLCRKSVAVVLCVL